MIFYLLIIIYKSFLFYLSLDSLSISYLYSLYISKAAQASSMEQCNPFWISSPRKSWESSFKGFLPLGPLKKLKSEMSHNFKPFKSNLRRSKSFSKECPTTIFPFKIYFSSYSY